MQAGAFSRKVEEELMLTPHALNAPTARNVPQPATAVNRRRLRKRGGLPNMKYRITYADDAVNRGASPDAPELRYSQQAIHNLLQSIVSVNGTCPNL